MHVLVLKPNSSLEPRRAKKLMEVAGLIAVLLKGWKVVGGSFLFLCLPVVYIPHPQTP